MYLLRSVQSNLDDLVKIRRDEKFSKYFDKDVKSAINFLEDSSSEISSLIKIYELIEEPVIIFQESVKVQIHKVWPFIIKFQVKNIRK